MTSSLKQEAINLRLGDPDLLDEEAVALKTSPDTSTVQDSNQPAPTLLGKDSKGTSKEANGCPYRFIPLRMGGGGRTHVVSKGSASLITNEVSLEDLQIMTERFYEKVFRDPTLDAFIRSHDDPHGARFAKWIHQKLSGSNVWDEDRAARDLRPVVVAGGRTTIVHDRSSAHVAAWYSPKRPEDDVGRHFQLDECRIWMRLHFWALRESGILEKSPSFADYYVRFIGHFVRVYESTAPAFARESFRWSMDPSNIDKYRHEGVMNDVLGLSLEEARDQIPLEEAFDEVWPYNKTE